MRYKKFSEVYWFVLCYDTFYQKLPLHIISTTVKLNILKTKNKEFSEKAVGGQEA